jgi:hypothetical protein
MAPARRLGLRNLWDRGRREISTAWKLKAGAARRIFSTFACNASMLCWRKGGNYGHKEEGVNWLRHLVLRWSARHFSLVCPHCRRPASPPTFKRGRFMLGDQKLSCEQCGETSVVTFWRFEGLSRRPECAEATGREPLANSPR